VCFGTGGRRVAVKENKEDKEKKGMSKTICQKCGLSLEAIIDLILNETENEDSSICQSDGKQHSYSVCFGTESIQSQYEGKEG
jgi:hypothetical protein